MDLLPLSTFGVFLATCAAGFVFDTDIDAGGPGIFSSRVIGVFITAFGGFGAIGVYYGLSPVSASLLGMASGAVFAAAIYSIARFLYRQQASSDMRSDDLVGQSCRVVVSIPSGGMGQVRCRIGEELVDKIAQARDGGAIAANTPVHIEEVLGETVIVSKH
jgi:membrane protein implicated in regulation of membrane protease activity